MMIAIPSLTDRSLSPPGHHVLMATALVAADARQWSEDEETVTAEILDRLDRIMPGFSHSLVQAETSTPQTVELRTGNHAGAMYGWANSPDQVAARRPANDAPIDGLYLAGHWTQPGSGSIAVIFSGLRAAQLALGERAEHLGASV